eukprot:CAMPEP_0197263436 /NCGR_PEP_ID=MMETSP1432-20130617/1160_1 /TAXON_ID=44447 /ORGANISM="Pseudo-nitzschia delicatissima, Strain UNC1205" /LENGTH=414 /DNA_ID=CAMNT_0042727927 /DNA_START=216 /DNA_END=1460 /DNA_ORIENTATION=-
MTGNAGPGEAMAWAVGHAMDPDINSPMIMLKSSNRSMIDESSIQLLQKSVIQLSNILEDPLSRSAFLQSIINRVPNGSANPQQARVIATKAKPKAKTKKPRPVTYKATVDPTPPKRITENKPKLPSKKPPSKDNGTIKPVPTKAAEITVSKPIAPISPKPPKRVVKPMPPLQEPPSKANETKVPVPTKLEQEVKPIKTAAPEKRRPPPPPPRARTPVPKSALTKSVEKKQSNETLIHNGVAKTKATVATTAKPTMDREELLRRGKAALDKLKRGESATTKTAKADPKVAKAVFTTSQTRTATTRTLMDREALLKRGQEAFHKVRNQKGAVASNNSKPKIAVQKPSNDSRRKLIEEGRKLMLQSKTSKASAVPTTKKAAPPPKAKPTPPPKAVKLASDVTEEADPGWDFDDFDNF